MGERAWQVWQAVLSWPALRFWMIGLALVGCRYLWAEGIGQAWPFFAGAVGAWWIGRSLRQMERERGWEEGPQRGTATWPRGSHERQG